MIPESCEWIRLPSLNNILYERATFLNRTPFMGLSRKQGLSFRRDLIGRVVDSFAPDIIVVEQSPLGMLDELDDTIFRFDGKLVFLCRGILSHPSRVRRFILKDSTLNALAKRYHKIIVLADRAVWDLDLEYGLQEEIAKKIEYVGYLSDQVDDNTIQEARKTRGLTESQKWVVCSAGGGALGENLIKYFTEIANDIPDVLADVVQGPKSNLDWEGSSLAPLESGRVRLHREVRNLPLMHAAADVVVCTGAYNSMIEAMEGGASILAFPVQLEPEDEQFLHSTLLSKYYPIQVVAEMKDLLNSLDETLCGRLQKASVRKLGTLDFAGAEKGARSILSLL
jgi:predicted glycosyltransferase